MRLPNVGDQFTRTPGYRADGSIASASLPQLILPSSLSRSSLLLQNTSSAIMWVEMGSARAHATITGGVVTSITIDNAGFNFTKPPVIELLGGGNAGNSTYLGLGQPGAPSPNSQLTPGRPAKAHAVLSGGVVNSIVVDDGGAGYAIAPYVFIINSDLDPYGCADPSANSGSGFQLYPGQSLYEAHSVVVTDPIALFCATISSSYFCRYTT